MAPAVFIQCSQGRNGLNKHWQLWHVLGSKPAIPPTPGTPTPHPQAAPCSPCGQEAWAFGLEMGSGTERSRVTYKKGEDVLNVLSPGSSTSG
jgi:hypothetical protein